jgi:mono/diheme cytochrome c family protein
MLFRLVGVTTALIGTRYLAVPAGGFHPAFLRAASPADTGHDAASTDGANVTPAMISSGRSIYHGQGGCVTCHGANLQGSAVAPPLDKQGKPWLAAKGGTYAAVVNVITHGVLGTLMIAHPNGINDATAAQVAAHIWAVNHNGVKP